VVPRDGFYIANMDRQILFAAAVNKMAPSLNQFERGSSRISVKKEIAGYGWESRIIGVMEQ